MTRKKFCEPCYAVVTPAADGDCPHCGAGLTTLPARVTCPHCDGEGFGPSYVGNCPACGGCGKVQKTA